jgi:hypothetical protein
MLLWPDGLLHLMGRDEEGTLANLKSLRSRSR